MFTFFKRGSSKHKYDDSRSASGTPPPSSSRLPSPSLLSSLSSAAGGGSGERKAPKNKRVRFKFVSDHHHNHREEDDQRRFEEPVSVSRSDHLHGDSEEAPFDYLRDSAPNAFGYSVEEPLSPPVEGNQHVPQDGCVDDPRESFARPKPRSALNQLLDRMGGKKNRHRGHPGVVANSKKAKQDSVQQSQMRFIGDFNPQIETVKKCGGQDDVEVDDIYYDHSDGGVPHKTYARGSSGGGGDDSATFATHQDASAGGGCLYRVPQRNILVFDAEADDDEQCGAEAADNDDGGRGGGVGEITEVAAGKAVPPFNFNARGDENENRPAEILHKIITTEERSDDEGASWLSQNNNIGRIQKEQEERPRFRLFVNEQPTIAEEAAGQEADEEVQQINPAADFVRDLVLNRYKKKRDRPVNRRVDQDEIPTVIRTVPLVVEKSDDEEEGAEKLKMGQPSSKASSPNPLEKSSSDGSVHPAVIITEEEVFYEASEEPEIVHGVVDVPQQDDGILRIHSPLTIGGAFKTIHVSTEDLQDELEKEESETEDSGHFNANSVYQNTLKNKSGVTVTEILDENSHDSLSSSEGEDEEEEEQDSGCEGTLGSVSPQMRPSPVPIVVVEAMNGTSEEQRDSEPDSPTTETMSRKKMRLETDGGVHSLPDVVESIGLPNVLHHSVSAKLSQGSDSPVGKEKKMANGQNAPSQGVLHVDGNSQRSSVVRNIPITILEEASEEEEEEEKMEKEVSEKESEVQMKSVNGINGVHQNNIFNYRMTNGGAREAKEEFASNGIDCDKRDLVNQDALQSKGRAAELQAKLDELERTLSVKEWTIDRLEAELAAATKEGEGVRRKLKQQEEEMLRCRHKFEDSEDDLNRRYQDLEDRYQQMTEKLTNIQTFTSHLQVQLAEAQSDADSSRAEKEQLIRAREEEEKIIRDSLEQAIEERQQVEARWHREFEQLRNLNQDREEQLMQDVEWKMRSMQKQCKEKLDKAEELQRELVDITRMQEDKIESMKPLEAEVKALRGLTAEQRENLQVILRQLEEAKEELNEANERCEEEIKSAQKVKMQCENELLCKERYAQMKIEEAKMQISVQWERKLMEEMLRLKGELEAVHAEDRKEALETLKEEYTVEINGLVKAHKELEQTLNEEINRLKELLEVKKQELLEAQKNSDKQIVDTRIYVERSDRQNQLLLDREIRNREELIEQMEKDREREREEMEEQFRERLQSVKDEFARELVESTQEVEEKYKRIIGTIPISKNKHKHSQSHTTAPAWSMQKRRGSGAPSQQQQRFNLDDIDISESQIEKFVAEKEEQLETAETRHRHKIKALEEQMRALEVQFQREKSDYERNYNIERTSMAKREMQNSQEIDTLHRKCRCLTKLFEEMRMRYERREPRQEDQREIAELKERCESQERDLARLTEALRQLQIIQEHQHPAVDATMPTDPPRPQKGRMLASPGHNCDVIYEEQEPPEEEYEAELKTEEGDEEEEEEEQSTATSIDETTEGGVDSMSTLLAVEQPLED